MHRGRLRGRPGLPLEIDEAGSAIHFADAGAFCLPRLRRLCPRLPPEGHQHNQRMRVSVKSKILSIAIGLVAVLALMLVYFLGPGKAAEPGPAGGTAEGPVSEVEGTMNQETKLPLIDANRPVVTEVAAFALG